MVQLSHPYMTTGKTIALTRWTFVSEVIRCLGLSYLFFQGASVLIPGLQSLSVVILEYKKIICHYFHNFPFYLPWSDGTGCHDLSFLTVELFRSLLSPLSRGSSVPLHRIYTNVLLVGSLTKPLIFFFPIFSLSFIPTFWKICLTLFSKPSI